MSHPDPIEVIGLTIGDAPDAAVLARIRNADALAGGERLLAQVSRLAGTTAESIVLKTPLEEVFAAIARARDQGRRVAVLADGDPLFFGIGARLIEYFGQDAVRVTPAVTAVAAACARLSIPWHDLPAVSLHGRGDLTPLFAALRLKGRAAVYTDAVNSPDALARRLLDLDIAEAALWILENMGTPDERIRAVSLREAAGLTFSPLNVVIVETSPAQNGVPVLGRPDDFYERQNGLITKWPVRACALAALRLPPDCVLWDVGAGSGAVSVEACALVRTGRVFAVERDPDRCRLIRENRKRSRAWLMEVVQATAPEAFAALPDPDRIFLGGGLGGNRSESRGGESPQLLAEACSRLKPGGRLAANVVLLSSLHAVLHHLNGLGWPVEIAQIQANLSSPLGSDTRLGAQHPVFIVCADKPVTDIPG